MFPQKLILISVNDVEIQDLMQVLDSISDKYQIIKVDMRKREA